MPWGRRKFRDKFKLADIFGQKGFELFKGNWLGRGIVFDYEMIESIFLFVAPSAFVLFLAKNGLFFMVELMTAQNNKKIFMFELSWTEW